VLYSCLERAVCTKNVIYIAAVKYIH